MYNDGTAMLNIAQTVAHGLAVKCVTLISYCYVIFPIVGELFLGILVL
jgi:hypothetical protein